MTRTGSPNEGLQETDGVTERGLVTWSWAVGGWAGVHAGMAVLAFVMGAQLNLVTLASRVLGVVTVGGWATAAVASWRFRQSFRMRTGILAAIASVLAGVSLAIVGDASSGAIVDAAAHSLAGLGFAAML